MRLTAYNLQLTVSRNIFQSTAYSLKLTGSMNILQFTVQLETTRDLGYFRLDTRE